MSVKINFIIFFNFLLKKNIFNKKYYKKNNIKINYKFIKLICMYLFS